MEIGVIVNLNGFTAIKCKSGIAPVNVSYEEGSIVKYDGSRIIKLVEPDSIEEKFEFYKGIAKDYGEECIENSYSLDIPNIYYKKYNFSDREEVILFDKGLVYVKEKGMLEEKEYKGYETTYILIVDGKFIKSSENIDDLWEYVADNYDLSIDYYGHMSKDEVYHREYTDYHEGLESFIANVKDLSNGKNIDINVLDVNYMFDYTDCEDIVSGYEGFLKERGC